MWQFFLINPVSLSATLGSTQRRKQRQQRAHKDLVPLRSLNDNDRPHNILVHTTKHFLNHFVELRGHYINRFTIFIFSVHKTHVVMLKK